MSWITLTNLGKQYIDEHSSEVESESVAKSLNVLNVIGDAEAHGVNVSVDNISHTLRDAYPKDDVLRIIRDLSKDKLISSGDVPLYHRKGEFLSPPPKNITILDFDEDPIGDVKIKKRKVNREQLQEIRDEASYDAWIEGHRYCPKYEPKYPYSESSGECAKYNRYTKRGCGYPGIPKEVCRTGVYEAVLSGDKEPNPFMARRIELPSFEGIDLTTKDVDMLKRTGKKFKIVHGRDEENVPIRVNVYNQQEEQ